MSVQSWPEPGVSSGEETRDDTAGQPIAAGQETSGTALKDTKRYPGTGRFYEASDQGNIPLVEDREGEGYNLNFSETDIRTVMEAVVGDILGQPYFVNPNIRETISLQTSREIGKEGLIQILETVLRIKGLAIVDVNGVLHVVPLSEAPRRTTRMGEQLPESHGRPGFGVQVVPLRYTTPSQLRRLLEPFAPEGGILTADDSRNMLIIAGTRQEIAGMLETINTFDVDWLAGMSYALFKVRYVEVETLSKELLNIFGDPQSPIAGMIRLVPIPRLNAILAISAQDRYLSDVEAWVSRLDIGGGSTGRKIYVYHVKNGRATDLASAMGRILGDTDNTEAEARDTPHSPSATASSAAETSLRQLSPSSESFGSIGSSERQTEQQTQTQPAERTSTTPSAFEIGGLRIVPIDESNSLLIMATPSEFSTVEGALKQLDIAPRQVLIEATLAEVTLTDELRYGVQWMFEPGDHSITQTQTTNGSISSEFPGFSYVFTGASDARVVLNALESMTDVQVLFSPKLMVLNNQSAKLQVGDQVPVPVQSAISTGDSNAPIVNSIEFRDTGVILSVTPRINEGGLVLIDIEQEVSDVVPTRSSGIDAPTIQQRKITSSVAVQSGNTIALGGLIRENSTKGKSGVPIISGIPIIGAAFGAQNNVLRRTELIVLITPRIVRDVRETSEVMEYLREQFRSIRPQNASE